MAGAGSMIGSGWLFGAWKAARLAGPAAILTWPLGALVILLLALAYAELGARFPTSGGMVRYTQLSHGSFAGFIAGWANWIAIITGVSIEAASSIQYLSSWPYDWTNNLYHMNTHELTPLGLLAAAALIVVYFLLNYWSLKLFVRSMVAVTVVKLCVPFITCIALFASAFGHHTYDITHGDFMPYGFSSVLTAIATAGIVFSFQGFQSAINLSGEAKNPGRNVPIAVILSILIALVIYTALQIAFIGSIDPKSIANGWSTLRMRSPYVDLAMAFQLNWLVVILYFDAFVSPSGTGITYTGTTSRMLFSMQKNGYMPSFIGQLHPRFHIPRNAMWVNLVVSFIFLYLFKGWNNLVSVISVSAIIAYVNGPISAVVLRQHKSKIKSPLKIPGLRFISPIAFVGITLVLYWARWPLTGEVIFIMLIGMPIFLYYQYKENWQHTGKHLRSGAWLVCYLLVIALLSYIGSTTFGGLGLLNTSQSTIIVLCVAIGFYIWGLRSGLTNGHFNFNLRTEFTKTKN